MLYYINLVFFYSLLGFVLESVVYKHNNTNAHSSIFTGPYTLVYGFGMLFCILCYEIGKGIISNTMKITNIILGNIFVLLIQFVGVFYL